MCVQKQGWGIQGRGVHQNRFPKLFNILKVLIQGIQSGYIIV